MIETGNLFAGLASNANEERFDTFLARSGARIERIVSTGQATPAGEWLQQDATEWVALLSGSASLRFEDEAAPRALKPGDWIAIPGGRDTAWRARTPMRPPSGSPSISIAEACPLPFARRAARGLNDRKQGRKRSMKKGLIAIVSLWVTMVAAPPAGAADLTHVNVGTANSATDVGVFVAQAKGFFRDEGLDVSFIAFDSAAKMIAPFASGDLDVGGGGTSAGLYNAVSRGIEIKIVADKNHTPPGQGIQPLLVRKDLIDGGGFKTLADLKGLKISTAAPGSAASTTLDHALRMAGLTIGDVDQVYMGFPQQAAALASKAIDAAFTAEPSASQAVASGSAVRFMGDDEIYPDHQLAVVFYSGDFIRKKPDAARRYMRAYLRGVRYYNDAIENGKLVGARGEEIIDFLAQNIPIKDKAAYRDLTAPACDPDGKMNVDSLKEDLEFYRKTGLIEGDVKLEQTLDTSFAERAVKELGVYQRGGRK